jgi:hypothetical protein
MEKRSISLYIYHMDGHGLWQSNVYWYVSFAHKMTFIWKSANGFNYWWDDGFTSSSVVLIWNQLKRCLSQIYEKKFSIFSQHHSHKQIFNTSCINLHFFFLQFNWLNFNWIKLDLNSILGIWIQFKVGTQCHSIFSFELNLIFIIWIHYFH